MLRDDIEQLIKPAVEDLGCEVWACDYLPQGRYATLRIYIDSPRGITLDDCERVSRQVSALLDVNDPISSAYNLEISSPGIPRPLYKEAHYEKMLGQEIKLQTVKSIQGTRKHQGRLVRVANGQIEIDNPAGEKLSISLGDVVKAFALGE